MKPDLPDCALIGGTPEERTTAAIRLRRMGIATFAETANRKRAKMFARACNENRWGKAGVYDLDDADDRAWIEREDLATVGV